MSMWAIKKHFCQLKHQQLDWFGCVTCYDIPFKVISREQVRVGEEVVKTEKNHGMITLVSGQDVVFPNWSVFLKTESSGELLLLMLPSWYTNDTWRVLEWDDGIRGIRWQNVVYTKPWCGGLTSFLENLCSHVTKPRENPTLMSYCVLHEATTSMLVMTGICNKLMSSSG